MQLITGFDHQTASPKFSKQASQLLVSYLNDGYQYVRFGDQRSNFFLPPAEFQRVVSWDQWKFV